MCWGGTAVVTGRRLLSVIGVCLLVALAPSTAWADGGAESPASGFVLGLAPSAVDTAVAPMTLEQAQSAVYAAGPTEVTLSPAQWDVFIFALGIIIALSAAALVLGLRR